jgi:hypothetical protein
VASSWRAYHLDNQIEYAHAEKHECVESEDKKKED